MSGGAASCGVHRIRRVAIGALLIAVAGAATSVSADVTGEQVKRTLRLGVRAIKERQLAAGGWPERYYPGGETCLATLALLQAGEPANSDTLARALEQVRVLPLQHVYAAALKIMALARADAERYRAEIRTAAKWLVEAQNAAGLWSYGQGGERFDHSNSQFALLGLHAAAEAGIPIPAEVWKHAQEAVLRTQNRDGGWSYQTGNSYGSMTAAGVADLFIFGQTLQVGQERTFQNGVAPGCGQYRASRPLANGLKWLGRNFSAEQNPGRGGEWRYYWLYGAERVGMLSGERNFGTHDWFREGARFLVAAQGANGLWGDSVADTSMAVLFLAKGHKPLLIQKLRWSEDAAWNLDRQDLEHLVASLGDQLGEPTTWQVVEFDAPPEDWLAAPLLYVQGHRFPIWNDAQRQKVRRYVEQGGTLLAEACCSRAEFRSGFEEFAAQTFPETPLRELGAEHAVYHALHNVAPTGLLGLDVGCRTSVIFSPHDFSCLWEQHNVPTLSADAFRLGANIAAYATGRQPLRDRLDVVTLPGSAAAEAAPATGDAIRLAQIAYDGDWRPDPLALVKFAEFLRDELKLDVITRYRAVRLTDADLYTCPIVFLTGHFEFRLGEAERAALAAHLRRGGFLLAEACCGRPEFDRSFRALMRELFPDIAPERLPPDHAIFQGRPGFALPMVRYREAVGAGSATPSAPELWGWTIDGRLAAVYSPYALGCGLDGHVCFNCRGVVSDDARKLAANIVLYALTH